MLYRFAGEYGVIFLSWRTRSENYNCPYHAIVSSEPQVDLDLLRKLHKLQDVETDTLEASLVSRIAAKDAL